MSIIPESYGDDDEASHQQPHQVRVHDPGNVHVDSRSYQKRKGYGGNHGHAAQPGDQALVYFSFRGNVHGTNFSGNLDGERRQKVDSAQRHQE